MNIKDLLNWLIATIIACLTAGISGILAILLLRQTSAWASDISASAPWALPVMMVVVGVVAGFIWWWIRLKKSGSIVGVVQKGEDVFLPGRSSLDAGLQVAAVGFGASMGREAAPRLLAATLTWAAGKKLPRETRVLVTAGAAGGALGTVYDAPWAGALYTLTILLPTLEWRTVITAVAASWSGVSLSKLLLGEHSNYTLGTVNVNAMTWAWVAIVIICAPIIGLTFKALQKRLISGKVPLKLLPLTVAAAFGAIGLIALVRPEIMGNGVAIMQHALAGDLSLQVLLLIVVLKAFTTILTLSAGAVGGVLMPAFSLGAAFGGAGAAFFPDSNIAVFVVVAAAAVLSVTEKSWMFAVCFGLELVDAPLAMWLPVLVAGFGAYQVAQGFNRWTAARS